MPWISLRTIVCNSILLQPIQKHYMHSRILVWLFVSCVLCTCTWYNFPSLDGLVLIFPFSHSPKPLAHIPQQWALLYFSQTHTVSANIVVTKNCQTSVNLLQDCSRIYYLAEEYIIIVIIVLICDMIWCCSFCTGSERFCCLFA